jgi:DNA-binding Lrp family transcriptional regulator
VAAAVRTETVRILDRYSGIREISKQLDSTNIKILTAMAEIGPRNLLEVSRRIGVPFTTVCHRVLQLEARSRQIAISIPEVAKLGMSRLVILTAAKPGMEEAVTEALMIPDYWRVVEPCEGAFTHHSIQTVPREFLGQFKEYISKMQEMNLIRSYRIIPTGDSVPNFPDFTSYDPRFGEWTFRWDAWLNELKEGRPTRIIADPEEKVMRAKKIDLHIIALLEMNARANFTDIAQAVNTSPQNVKYHYDNKLTSVLERFQLDVVPYPIEMSAYHEFMLQFTNAEALNRFFSVVKRLFFVVSAAKVLRKNALFVRTYILSSQVANMFDFFSQMAKDGLLESYSSVRLNLNFREQQTISFDLYDDEKGWTWDFDRSLAEVERVSQPVAR